LKDIAKRLQVPIVLLSQLNRQSANRAAEERLPRLSDLRDSGSIEQDCDCCLGIYRKYPDTQNSADRSDATLVVLKNRNGATGKLEMTWIPELAQFLDSSGSQPEEIPF
jgi:replicative DNA helicase